MALMAVPLEAYESAPDPFVLTDSRGRVRMINAAAGRLLECDPQHVLGRRCWGVVGLHTSDGVPICRRDCNVRRRLAGNLPCVRQRGVRTSSSGRNQRVDVFTLKVEATSRSWGVLHMFVPVKKDDAPSTPRLPVPGSVGLRGLELLTRREREILRALAAGESTNDIAAGLFISVATVRNHIRSILSKLEVGSRLEAVLIWLSQFR
ncbi:MAG: PAS domain-containing protein [Acidobacteria bacterium]|nr:PAS domain-containing protein [Acidobacteriota bacterium]NIQ83294.1 PAS domain-containing protein [Acidobacteriota bacterium]